MTPPEQAVAEVRIGIGAPGRHRLVPENIANHSVRPRRRGYRNYARFNAETSGRNDLSRSHPAVWSAQWSMVIPQVWNPLPGKDRCRGAHTPGESSLSRPAFTKLQTAMRKRLRDTAIATADSGVTGDFMLAIGEAITARNKPADDSIHDSSAPPGNIAGSNERSTSARRPVPTLQARPRDCVQGAGE